jgi:glycosyltransferase involved in cell wall biosynthesis
MTRVLVIEPAGNLWGSERALLDLLGSVHTMELAVCCPPKMPLNNELERRQVRTLPYFIARLHEKSRWHRLWAAFGVLRACLEFRPDVIYLNQSGCYRVSLVAATLLNLPMVAHVRIFEDPPYLARRRPSARRLRGILAISSAIEQEILRFPELRGIPLHRIYDGYAASHGSHASRSVGTIGSRVAYLGRIVPNKGVSLLVGALNVMHSLGGNVECLIAGDGDERFVGELKREASNGNAAAAIQWLGIVGDTLPLLQTCSVLAVPSYHEALGRVIFEAWNAGVVPVAFSGSGGAAEVIVAAQGGVLYDAQTPESLARGLQNALSLSQQQRDQLISNGRSWLAANCNAEAYGAAVAEVLEGSVRSRSHLS